MASFCSYLTMFMALALALSPQQIHAQYSTISAAPAFLPISPSPSILHSAPSLSPDITPLFPTPGGNAMPPSPAESSLPTIPSSTSPPNPDDDLLGHGPGMALPPAEALPASSSVSSAPTGPLNFPAFVGLVLCCFMQLVQL